MWGEYNNNNNMTCKLCLRMNYDIGHYRGIRTLYLQHKVESRMVIILCLIILLLYIYVVYHISDMCMILQ